jgi:uncharacterized protein (TIGR00255 family)
MISSMTGFAAVEQPIEGGVLLVELRSVNHRYLEILFKIDEGLRMFEPAMRENIQAKLNRGKLDCKVTLKQTHGSHNADAMNHEVLQQLSNQVKSVANYFEHVQPINVLQVLGMPGVMQVNHMDSETLLSAVLKALTQALDALLVARQREGDKLQAIILQRLEDVAALVMQVKPMLPTLIAAYQDKLSAKLLEVMVTDDERVRQEMVLYAQKIDVDEELSRLEAHVSEVRSIVGKGGVAGKKLDFLMQEMNREANTLGSKSVAIETTNISMQLKVLIEQMREQIQNIE